MADELKIHHFVNRSEEEKRRIDYHYLRNKTIIVNIMLIALFVPVFFALYNYERPVLSIVVYLLFLTLIIGLNFLFLYRSKDFNNLKLPMVITTLGIYLLSLSLIIDIQSASIFTFLFLAFAIVSIYQDRNIMMLNIFLMFMLGTILIFTYPTMFELTGGAGAQIAYIYVFLLLFMLLLSISSFIQIKRKSFLYNQLAQIKEVEIRTINTLIELKRQYSQSEYDFDSYYGYIKEFFDALAKTIKLDNIFAAHLEVIQELHDMEIKDLVKKYPEANYAQIAELKRLELSVHSQLHYELIRASQTTESHNEKRDILSKNIFASFKHSNDDKHTKIIAFATFYTMLKVDKLYLPGLDGKTIRSLLQKNKFYHLIDNDILDIYFSNSKLFDKIATDALGKLVSS